MGQAAVRENSIDFLKVCATILIVFHHYEQAFGRRGGFLVVNSILGI